MAPVGYQLGGGCLSCEYSLILPLVELTVDITLSEGAPSCISALFVWFILPDYPEESFLKGRDLEIALARLRVEGSKGSSSSMTLVSLLPYPLYSPN